MYISGCVPIQFWSINRHGPRLPTEPEIEELPNLVKTRDSIIENYEQRRSYPDQVMISYKKTHIHF